MAKPANRLEALCQRLGIEYIADDVHDLGWVCMWAEIGMALAHEQKEFGPGRGRRETLDNIRPEDLRALAIYHEVLDSLPDADLETRKEAADLGPRGILRQLAHKIDDIENEAGRQDNFDPETRFDRLDRLMARLWKKAKAAYGH